MKPTLEPWNDPTLEARVVACVLGEASAFERAEVERLLSESPELAAFARRIRAVHGLLGEATRGGAEDSWKMEPERRSRLLLALGAPAPTSLSIPVPAPRKQRFSSSLLTLAATIAFGLIASTVFFSAGSGRRSNVTHVTVPGIASKTAEPLGALETGVPTDLLRDTPTDLSAELAAHEEQRTKASKPSQPFSSASVITIASATPTAPPAPLVDGSDFKGKRAEAQESKQVAVTTKDVEVGQRNNEELGYDWIVADENGKAQAGGKLRVRSSEAMKRKEAGAAVALDHSRMGRFEDSNPTPKIPGQVFEGHSLDFDGFANLGAPLARKPTEGLRSGDAAITREGIEAILDGKITNADELSGREDVAKIEVIRESKPDVGLHSASNPQSRIIAGVATETPFPVTPATPAAFEERADPFGNIVIFPAEYEPPELPNSVDGGRREEPSRIAPEQPPLWGDVPLFGRLFHEDRWKQAPTLADALVADAQAISGKPENEGERKFDSDVDPFAPAADEAMEDPFAAEPAKSQPQEKSPTPEQKQSAPTLETQTTEVKPVSTFSLHVSDASFQIGARALLGGTPVAPESVRAEDYVNAMDYGDVMPARGEAVSAIIQQSGQPFVPGRNLLRIGVRTAAEGRVNGQPLSLVLLVDRSGSMERADRVDAMTRAMIELSGLLGKDDVITVIGFAREPRLLADRLSGDHAGRLPELIRNSPPQGGTNLETAFDLAAEAALRQAKPGAQNRLVLFTDGAANLGQINPESLGKRVEVLRRKRIAFDACGVGTADLADNMLEAMARRGDGRYIILNAEGETSLAKQLAGAFRPAARDVKVQVRFNPERVEAYHLFGFEKHLLNEEDFRDDNVDAAELAAAEQGNALYQLKLRAQGVGDIGDVAVRFQDTSTGRMVERNWTIPYDPATPALDHAAASMQLAASAGLLAEVLRGSTIGQSVDPAALLGVHVSVRAAFSGDSRVNTLLAMWEQVRQRY